MTTVVCVGDLLVDVLARLPSELAPGSDTPAAVELYGGGAAANVAAWSVRAGATAVFVGRVGDDPLGRAALAELRAAGVDVRAQLDAHRPTGTCIVLVDPTGERTMVPSAGANAAPGDLAALPEHADALYVSGYALLREQTRDYARAVLATGRDRGWPVAVDAASAAPLAAVGAALFLDWLDGEVLLFANAAEAEVLAGTDDPAAAATVLGGRCGAAIVKRGAAGAVWSDGSRTEVIDAHPRPVVDSTGAGDAFAAGFLATAGDVPARLAAGSRLAAAAIGAVGARPTGALSAGS